MATEAAAKPDAAAPPRVAYMRDDASCVTDFALHVPRHAMKPWRLLPVHSLVDVLGLSQHMRIVTPPMLPEKDLLEFHTPEYIDGLRDANHRSWEHTEPDQAALRAVPYSPDCPVVESVMEFSRSVASGSVWGARLLCNGEVDVAINWAGGMHHAHPGECSGFCYINDINLAILELLKSFHRVLYIDIDVHHGDGVEEAFCWTDRVFTLSLHRYGDSFFPGTGSSADIGFGRGRYYAMNVPLSDGVGDVEYVTLFRYALERIAATFQPEAIVLQCGADSLAGDRVGVLNLSSVGHGRCVELVRELVNVPTLVLGGGGYTVRNVAKLWAYETSLLLRRPLPPSTRIFPPDPPQPPTTKADDVVADEGSKPARRQQRRPKRGKSPKPSPTKKDDGKRGKGKQGAAAAKAPEAPPEPPAKIDAFQELMVTLGITTACTTHDGAPLDVTAAMEQRVLAPLRTIFADNEVLYVPADEFLVRRYNVAKQLDKLRHLIDEQLTHVTAPRRVGGPNKKPEDGVKAEPVAPEPAAEGSAGVKADDDVATVVKPEP